VSADHFEAVRIPKAAELVATDLRRKIILGELSASDLLPSESVLLDEFGVSRPTLREAFRILESEALIEVRRGARGGARVCPPDGTMAARHAGYLLQFRGTTMSDVYRARTQLELPLGTAIANDERPSTVERLERALEEAEKHLERPADYAPRDLDFHLLVAELAGNETIRTVLEMVYDILAPARSQYLEVVTPGELGGEHAAAYRTHAYFVRLIRRGEVDRAVELWAKHLEEIEVHYTSRPLARTVVEMLA